MWTKSIALLLFGLGMVSSRAQLAITEAMSSASTNLGATLVVQNSDFWELSNFSATSIDLAGYSFNDNSGGLIGADPSPFTGLIIGPGESIVFVENAAGASTTPEEFRAWWGLPAHAQVRMYTGNGLGSGGDGLRVWAPGATGDADFVDSVDFGAIIRGRSFGYDINIGTLTWFSTNGLNRAFKAVTADDCGSPGTNAGPVPLVITQHPTNLSVNPGDNATFSVFTRGLPRAKFQWRCNGTNIDGARFSTLTVTNVQTGRTGPYSVVIFNGFDTLASSNAVIALNAAPEPPAILTPPANQIIYVGQGATFTVVASGVPQPTYQWRYNGTPIAGAAGNSYTLNKATLASTGVYSVVVSNAPVGVVFSQATLDVTPRPNLVITEVCSDSSTNGGANHGDWWEISNLDTFAVDLFGYLFDDGSSIRAAAYTITNHVTLSPGESIVFVEGMTPRQFRNWWGALNLRTNLQIISYSGSGLSLSSLGDGLVLWNPGATDDSDTIAATGFSTATMGVSFGFDADAQYFGDLSVIGPNGVFQAAQTGDIGSPGYTRTPPEPRVLRLTADRQLTWYGFSNRTYSIEFKDSLTATNWAALTNVISTGAVHTLTLPNTPSSDVRFLRVALQP